jgi:hypothetical protein
MIAKQQYTSTLTPSEKNAMYQYNREVQGITDVQPDYHPTIFLSLCNQGFLTA